MLSLHNCASVVQIVACRPRPLATGAQHDSLFSCLCGFPIKWIAWAWVEGACGYRG